MTIELVYGAVTRKMLCEPANSFIADTEWVCAAGILLRELQASAEVIDHILSITDIASVQKEMLSYLTDLAEIDLERMDKRLKNLLLMLKEYRGAEHEFTKEYQEIFRYGYQNDLTFPKGSF